MKVLEIGIIKYQHHELLNYNVRFKTPKTNRQIFVDKFVVHLYPTTTKNTTVSDRINGFSDKRMFNSQRK